MPTAETRTAKLKALHHDLIFWQTVYDAACKDNSTCFMYCAENNIRDIKRQIASLEAVSA